MIEPRVEVQQASDGYPLHVQVWPALGSLRGRIVIVHGVQSHGGWYHSLGRTLAEGGYEVRFPDRRGSGANTLDRGHANTARRLVADVAELLQSLRDADPKVTLSLAGISWGGKTALVTAAWHPRSIDKLALICPGLHPRVGVSWRERWAIGWAFLTNRRKLFPIPLSDPALFTANPEGRRFIAEDPLALRDATASLLAVSSFLDRFVRKARKRVTQPVLLMLGLSTTPASSASSGFKSISRIHGSSQTISDTRNRTFSIA